MSDDPTLPFGPEQRPESSESSERPEHSSASATTWGSFRLLARVGHGGFGEVYRAWDPSLEREVALKLLLVAPITADDPSEIDDQQYQALLREARALASVSHTNIVHIHGIDRHHGRVGFWTDFVRGKTLSALLAAQGPFGYREAAGIGLDIAKALSAVHRAGILHRDIKAENVMREEGGRILLMDFGLSTLPLRQGSTAGTPNYMAPELFERSPASVSSDLYALGVLLYYLVAGAYPANLRGLDAEQALAALHHRKPLMDLRPDLPETFLRTVNLATELDPSRRFHSAGHFAAALAECLGTTLTPDALALPSVTPAQPYPRALSSKIIRIIAAVLLTAAVLLSVVGLETLRSPAARHWLHLAPSPAKAPASTPELYEQFEKAQDLLLKSYKDSNTAAAVQGFQQVLQQDPGNALAHASLGAAYFIQSSNNHDAKLLDLAKQETNQALKLSPTLAPAYVTLARIAAHEGRTALAMQLAQKAKALDPQSPDVYGALAEVYEAQQLSKESMAALQQAIALAPEDWRWPVSLGIEEFSAGDVNEAAAQLQKAVTLAPDNAAAYYDLGIANMRRNNLEEARKDLQQALSIQPDADTYAELGSILMYQGKYAEAAASERKAIALNPDDYSVWGNLAEVYLWGHSDLAQKTEAFHKAIALAEAERTRQPRRAPLLAALAGMYASAGDAAHALPLIKQALAIAPDNPNVAYRAGTAYETLGQRAEAIPLIASALAKGYNSAEFQYNPELAGLRKDAAFLAVLHAANAKADSERQKIK
jgi:eukaryotic-like serine/threonine-protein kinase